MIFKLQYDKAVMDTDSLTTSEAMTALAWATVCDYETGKKVRQSFDSVAKKAKLSRRQVIRITQTLVEKGWLTEVERQPYKPTVYALTIPATTRVSPQDTSDTMTLVDEDDETSDTMTLVTNEARLVTNETPLVTNGTPTSVTMSPNKNNNNTINKNKDKNNYSAAGGAATSSTLSPKEEVESSLVDEVDASPLVDDESDLPSWVENAAAPAAEEDFSDTSDIEDESDLGFEDLEFDTDVTAGTAGFSEEEVIEYINDPLVSGKWKGTTKDEVLAEALKLNAAGFKGDLAELIKQAETKAWGW